jgi:hypothetical protein
MGNKQTYDDDVTARNASLNGIKEECVFNQLESFKVYENHSVDIMHDLLEGVFPYDLSLILKYFISKGYLNALKIGNLTEEITRKHLDNKALHFSSSDMLSFIKFYK